MKTNTNVVNRCVNATGKASAKSLVIAAVAAAMSFGAVSAHAAATTVDLSDVISTITGGVTVVSAIGVAVLSLVVVIKLFKWVQRAL